MLGPLTAGKKAAEFGYKAYGIPGAAVAGAGGAVGMLAAKKGVEAVVETDAGAEMETITEEGTAIDVETEGADDGDLDDFDDARPADR